jgi:hypothetical protein
MATQVEATIHNTTAFQQAVQTLEEAADPLRVKTLLFACLHGPPDTSPAGIATLEAIQLPELVWDIINYCPTRADLENKLTIMAHCLSDLDLNLQTVEVILDAIAPCYRS